MPLTKAEILHKLSEGWQIWGERTDQSSAFEGLFTLRNLKDRKQMSIPAYQAKYWRVEPQVIAELVEDGVMIRKVSNPAVYVQK